MDDPKYPHVMYRLGASGQPIPVIRSTSIRVQTIAIAFHCWEMTVARIAAEHDLTDVLVLGALAFYEAHREEIDANIRTEDALEAVRT